MRSALIAAGLILLAACTASDGALAPASTVVEAAPGATQESAGERLQRLFRESDDASLRRNPIQAIFRGDLRYADRFGDYITDAYFAGEREAGVADLAVLASIDREALNSTDRLAYDVFKYQTEENLADLQPAMLALTAVRPINHMSGVQVFYPVFASGQSAAPFNTVEDYENNLRRHAEVAAGFDRIIDRLRQGLQSGVLDTRLTIGNVIAQLDDQLDDAPEASPYY